MDRRIDTIILFSYIMIFYFMAGGSPEAYAKTVLMMNHQFQASDVGSEIDQWFADEIKRATIG